MLSRMLAAEAGLQAYSEEWHPDAMGLKEVRPLLTVPIGAIDHKSICHPLWLFLAVLGYTLLLRLLCPCARFYKVRKTLLCYPPFGGSWMGSLYYVHGMSLLVPANREDSYQNEPSLSYFHHVMMGINGKGG